MKKDKYPPPAVQKPSPTFLQIISTDYLGQNFFIMTFAGWAIYFVDGLFEGKTTFLLLVAAAILTPVGLLTFYWRYRTIVSTFANGIEIEGEVVDVETISTGRRREDRILHYEYNVNGRTYQYQNRVKKNSFARKVRAGQQVTLLAHEKTPHIAFIKDIYLEPL
ncbi:MAG: hypothetical protein C4557_03080 [Anaerolineaceae bacterium]|jgi:hypothetical protein|nr:MAG: hypothetical protein C4557_03080 [Anaerolineaceae bacterium]